MGCGLKGISALRILQVSTADVTGGAARVAWNLFTAYRELGHDSRLTVGYKESSDPDIRELFGRPRQISIAAIATSCERRLAALVGRVRGASRVRQWCRELERGLGPFLCRMTGREDFNFPDSKKLLQTHDIDIVHGHNLHGDYFDLRILPEFSSKVPLVLTLHDAWLLSGHCAHSFDCMRWQTGCGQCPDLSIYPAIKRDSTAFNWRRKQQIFARSKLYITTPSRWLMRRAEASILAPAIQDARVIPNGVDLGIFRPSGGRDELRHRLGLSSASLIIAFAGNGIRNNMFKDYKSFRAAIEHVAAGWSGDPLIFLAMGEEGAEERIGPVRLVFVPFNPNLAAFAQYLQASDVYVHPARADTFPNSVIEALACGTPVVASAVGGIPEQIEDARTGFLVAPGDPRNLAERVDLLLRDGRLRRRMGAAAAEIARRRFDLRQQAAVNLAWYEYILESRGDEMAPRVAHDRRPGAG